MQASQLGNPHAIAGCGEIDDSHVPTPVEDTSYQVYTESTSDPVVEADAISGIVTRLTLGLIEESITISPVDQSSSSHSGSQSQMLSNAQFSAFGVDIYKFYNIEDTTSAMSTASAGECDAEVHLGISSLLDGQVTFASLDDPLVCKQDAVNEHQVDCSAPEVIQDLKLANQLVPYGTVPAGTVFQIHGTINGGCLLRQTFDGTLTLNEITQTTNANGDVKLDVIGMHLRGTSVCLLFSWSTYDLKIAGPAINIAALRSTVHRMLEAVGLTPSQGQSN